ncbi:tyrosine-protein kinase receptor TYRO3-like isoform X1 [Patiria miniata]|uniref:receptor protein-tyrosine kinase n=1 Tax=Patiria miniata TaxID=46514 RepID=A0A914AQL0_PATMI|nr:tyrosine-protein kinase receptor TYRO3-like isoform X1 [Patiria miniata]
MTTDIRNFTFCELGERNSVFPKSITLSDSTGSYPSSGGTSYLIEGVDRQFTCEVPDINPGASFTWSRVDGSLTEGNTVNNTNADRLTTSTSLVTLSPRWSHHGEMLRCQASNKGGHAGISISILLDVTVLPSVSSMSLSDASGAVSGAVVLDQGTLHSFLCTVHGSRPGARIEWYLNDVMKRAVNPSPTGTDELVNTTDTWSLRPTRAHHRQELKCVASTTESQQPYPSLRVTLMVYGPPDVPDVTAATSMIENESVLLTCTADMGYPDDWSLDWTTGGRVISIATMSSQSGDRYRFTSELLFTPSREENGNTVITCTTSRVSLTQGPVGSLGPIDVQFCTRNVSVTQSPSEATEGNRVSLICTSESSNPAATLTWSKGNVLLTTPTDQPNAPGDNGGRVTTVIYTSDVLNKNNNGDVYTCCATNPTISSCAEDLCDMYILGVGYAPEFTSVTRSSDTPVTEGGNITLTCSVDANPRPSDITWKKRDSSEAFSSVYNDVTSTLTLSNIRREQAGYYMCRANNGVPTSNPSDDVVSDPITAVVHYEANITNKADSVIGAKPGGVAVLTCIVRANPAPTVSWHDPDDTRISPDSGSNKYSIHTATTAGDQVYGFTVTSTLTIRGIDPLVDYGVYTVNSSNGIGVQDSLQINVTTPRIPNKPTSLGLTDRTAESLTVNWTAGHDGGEEQSFLVSYFNTTDSESVVTWSEPVRSSDGQRRYTYAVTSLRPYTEYKIRVYAENVVGRNPDFGNVVGYTLPKPPTNYVFFKKAGTVQVIGLRNEGACIQLEVRYDPSNPWINCGECMTTDMTVVLSVRCPQPRSRRRRGAGAVEVRARLCYGDLCSEPVVVEQVQVAAPPESTESIIFIGPVIGAVSGLAVLVLVIALVVRVRKVQSYAAVSERNRSTTREGSWRFKSSEHPDTGATNRYMTELDTVRGVSQEQGVATYTNVPTRHTAFPRDQLQFVKELGHGAFGLVMLAKATGINKKSEVTEVAVKTLKQGAGALEKKDMLRELELMKKLPDHPNVVKLLGFCIDKDPVYIIVEYLSRGNLKSFLEDSRSKSGRVYTNLYGESKTLTATDLMMFAKDAADGMKFISSQKCIHRDLAARNVLVAEDMTCKVSDFGLARDVMNIRVYERESKGPCPIRWMAIESILDDVYTTESDVWSYGVLLWEIVTLGARPYPGMSAKILFKELQKGFRMPKPKHCQDELYELMLGCWDEDPESRPTFKMISKELDNLISEGKDYIAIDDIQDTIYEVTMSGGTIERL